MEVAEYLNMTLELGLEKEIETALREIAKGDYDYRNPLAEKYKL